MTKDLNTIDLNLLPLETLAEMANEAGEQAEKSARQTVQKAIDAGRYLTAAKEQLEHGQWLAWLGKNWNYTSRTAARYMEIGSKSDTVSDLKNAATVREALRMIAAEKSESEPATAPRSARKPADVVVSVPAETGYRDDSRAATTEGPIDPDPAPKPPTNRKTAKGSEKTPESDKPRTQQVPVEIVDDEPSEPDEESQQAIVSRWIRQRTIDELLDVWRDLHAAEGKFDAKATAKTLRKRADKLDPPDESPKPETVPTISKLIKAIPDEVGALRGVIEKWARHKQSLQGKARVRSMESWETMIEQMMKACDTYGVSEVSESIRSSIANGYTGWDIQLKSSNGKANGNGHATARNGRSRGLTADEVFSAESMGRGRQRG